MCTPYGSTSEARFLIRKQDARTLSLICFANHHHELGILDPPRRAAPILARFDPDRKTTLNINVQFPTISTRWIQLGCASPRSERRHFLYWRCVLWDLSDLVLPVLSTIDSSCWLYDRRFTVSLYVSTLVGFNQSLARTAATTAHVSGNGQSCRLRYLHLSKP